MKTNDLRHSITIIKGNERTAIKIKLNDECRNGHEDFSLTADIDEKTGNGRWMDAGGGCCHEHILKLRPDLELFARLHLCTHEGLPMHSAANAWYWFQGAFPEAADHSPALGACHGGTGSGAKSPDECKRIFAEHIHATPDQVAQIAALMPRSEIEMRAALEDCGFLAQWQAEADAAIKQLETWTGHAFESKATRGRWEPVTAEQRALIDERRRSGYYSPEQVAARDAQRREQAKQKRIAQIKADFAEAVEKKRQKMRVKLYFAERFAERMNVIYYNHTNTIEFNWSRCDRLISRAEFDAIAASLDRSALPDGIELEWKAAPKY